MWASSQSASGTSYAYDATGDRTNAGSATNLLWDAERRLVGWTSGSGATTATAAYDGEGQRVAVQTVTTSSPPPTPGRVKQKPLGPVGYTSTTSTTYYVLGLEDVTAGTITKCLGAGAGLPSAVRVGTTLSYLAVDGIGSVTEALDTSGNVTAQQLYAPYGRVRYQVGTLPTSKGYAGQRQDASSGLNDDAARYYDASTAQFASADTASDAGNGLDRLAYVGGNPETLTDPSGHLIPGCRNDCGGGIGSGSGSQGSGNPPTDNGPTCNQGGCTSGGGQTDGNNTGSRVKWPKPIGCGGCKVAQKPSNASPASSKQDTSGRISLDVAAMVFFGAGIIAGIILMIATLVNPALLEGESALAAIFGGNPLSAFFGIISATLGAASLFLYYLEDDLAASGNTQAAAVVQGVKTRVDELLLLSTFVMTASTVTGLGDALAAFTGPTIVKVSAWILATVTQVGAVAAAGATVGSEVPIGP